MWFVSIILISADHFWEIEEKSMMYSVITTSNNYYTKYFILKPLNLEEGQNCQNLDENATCQLAVFEQEEIKAAMFSASNLALHNFLLKLGKLEDQGYFIFINPRNEDLAKIWDVLKPLGYDSEPFRNKEEIKEFNDSIEAFKRKILENYQALYPQMAGLQIRDFVIGKRLTRINSLTKIPENRSLEIQRLSENIYGFL